jgi:hypothetical protein
MNKNKISFVTVLKWYIPLLVFITYFTVASYNFQLHDFANYYFASKAGLEFEDSSFIYSIYSFNSYVWSLGYPEVLVDFYINSPFTIAVFSPFLWFKNAFVAKLMFNIISSVLFLVSLYLLLKSKFNKKQSSIFLILLPVLFYVSFRNQILFGQSYFLVFSCIVFTLLLIEKQKEIKSGFILVFVSLLKIFPVIYGLYFLLNKKYKDLAISTLVVLSLILVAIWQSGFDIWKTYLIEVLPTTFKNHSGIGYQFNAQSVSVFLKTLFVKDDYYNPEAIVDSFATYTVLTWLYKSFIIALFIQGIRENSKNVFKVFVITTVSLFLLQDRTATYAQLLWIIPLIYLFTSEISTKIKFLTVFGILIICNIPLRWLEELPIILKFARMWFMLIVGIIFLLHFVKKIKPKFILYTCCFTIPISIFSIVKYVPSKAEYVLPNTNYFLVHEYSAENGCLTYKALGRNGEVKENTDIKINSINKNELKVIDNQVYYRGQQITFDNSLKAKPKLINNTQIYFLSDYNTRRGQFTLKKIVID